MPCANCGHDNTARLAELWQSETERANKEREATEPLVTWHCVFHLSRSLKPVGTFWFFPDGTVKGGGPSELDKPYRFKGQFMKFESPDAFERHVATHDRKLQLKRIYAKPPFDQEEAFEPPARATGPGSKLSTAWESTTVSVILVILGLALAWLSLWAWNKSAWVCEFTGGHWIEPPATSQASPRCIRL